MTNRTHALLTELLAEIRTLREEVKQLCQALRPMPDPRDALLARMLQQIYRTWKGRSFLVAELLLDAAVDEAVSDSIHEVVHDVTPQKLGKVFESIEKKDFAGLFVRRVGKNREGCLWQVFAL